MKKRTTLRLLAVSVMMLAAGCGGGGTAGPVPTPSPVPPPPPGPAPPPATGPAWNAFGRDAQHSAISAVATQALSRIRWSTPVDLAPQYQNGGELLIHYGSPVITNHNAVLLPLKTQANGGFRIEARNGADGTLVWSLDTDYVMPPHNWMPSWNLTLTSSGAVVAPIAGGQLLMRDSADDAAAPSRTLTFYGQATHDADPVLYDAGIAINTPVTCDASGNFFFGFVATGSTPANLVSGIARIGASGTGSWVAASAAAGDITIAKVQTNCAPAISIDGGTIYVAVNTNGTAANPSTGYLLALDATTLATKAKVALVDPQTGLPANVSDDGTASPTVAANGHVYFGVLDRPFGLHNGRGWLLHFTPQLTSGGAPGSFGWDLTPSLVPAAMVPSYAGSSAQLLAVKYNDYDGIGTGTGQNRMAVLDPGATQTDSISSLPVMREVLTVLGPTFESGTSGPVFEWCVNTIAVDPFTRSLVFNSEDGFLYRWDMTTNSLSQRIRVSSGQGEAYTPTAVGADGAVYAISNARLCSVGS